MVEFCPELHHPFHPLEALCRGNWVIVADHDGLVCGFSLYPHQRPMVGVAVLKGRQEYLVGGQRFVGDLEAGRGRR